MEQDIKQEFKLGEWAELSATGKITEVGLDHRGVVYTVSFTSSNGLYLGQATCPGSFFVKKGLPRCV